MSSIRAEMSGDTDELLQRLNRLSHLETRGVLNSIAEGLRTSTVERFTEEKTPEGTSWKPSIRAQEEGGKTLTKTTQLKGYPFCKETVEHTSSQVLQETQEQ